MHSCLERYAQTVIAVKFPDITQEHRLLRQSMMEALVEHRPGSKAEFVQRLPKYLREATEPREGRLFLEDELKIIEHVEDAD